MVWPSRMEFEEHLELTRAEIAERLRNLADQIAQGTVALGSARSDVPERAQYEIEIETSPRKSELKIGVEWR